MIIKDDALEPFFVQVEADQFVLKETKEIDTSHFLSKGEEGEREIHHGYFVSMNALVNKAIQIKMSRSEDVLTLQQFWQAWLNYSKKFTEIINSIT